MYQSFSIGPFVPTHQCVHGIGSFSRNFSNVSFFSSALRR